MKKIIASIVEILQIIFAASYFLLAIAWMIALFVVITHYIIKGVIEIFN